MAAPAYATDLVDITTSFSTNWNLTSEGGGGQNSLTAPETDDFIQGTEAVSRNPFSSSIRGIAYDRAAIAVATDDAVFFWWKADVAQALDTFAGGGVHLLMGSTTSDYRKYYVAGNDTYQLGGWRCTPIDPTTTQSATRGTPGSPNWDTFGVAFDVPATGPSKGFPFKIDMIRHGRHIDITAGDSGDPATWTKLATYADVTSRRWGIVQGTASGAIQQGITNWGTTGASVYSRDSNRGIVLADTLGFVVTGFTQINFNNASTDLEWDGITFRKIGTTDRGTLAVNNNAKAWLTNCVFINMNTFSGGGSNTKFDGSKFIGCNAVTVASAPGSYLNCQWLTPTVAANTSALIWNSSTNPNSKLDGSTFTKGTNAHHAIEFGLSSPTAITLTDMTFTGFNASNNVNDSVLHIKRTSGTVTITLSGTSQPSYRTDGATVVFVTGAVTTEVNTVTVDGTAVSGANVLLYATPTTGSLPANVTVTIANSGTTATVTHTAHGLSTNDRVRIKGASHAQNNGVFQITVTGTNTYTYTMGSAPGSSPTGTIKAWFVFLYGTTNGSGNISMSRSIPANQSVTGWARKGTGTPLYKTAPLSGTVNSTTGFSGTGVMILDE